MSITVFLTHKKKTHTHTSLEHTGAATEVKRMVNVYTTNATIYATSRRVVEGHQYPI